jgi:hypothetical protein
MSTALFPQPHLLHLHWPLLVQFLGNPAFPTMVHVGQCMFAGHAASTLIRTVHCSVQDTAVASLRGVFVIGWLVNSGVNNNHNIIIIIIQVIN